MRLLPTRETLLLRRHFFDWRHLVDRRRAEHEKADFFYRCTLLSRAFSLWKRSFRRNRPDPTQLRAQEERADQLHESMVKRRCFRRWRQNTSHPISLKRSAQCVDRTMNLWAMERQRAAARERVKEFVEALEKLRGQQWDQKKSNRAIGREKTTLNIQVSSAG